MEYLELKNDEELRKFISETDYFHSNFNHNVIKDYISKVNDGYNNALSERKLIDNAALDFYGYDIEIDNDKYREVMKELNEKVEIYSKHKELITKLLEEKQKQCPHDNWHYTGHDSHYDYYVCEKCGKEDRI